MLFIFIINIKWGSYVCVWGTEEVSKLLVKTFFKVYLLTRHKYIHTLHKHTQTYKYTHKHIFRNNNDDDYKLEDTDEDHNLSRHTKNKKGDGEKMVGSTATQELTSTRTLTSD